MKKSKILFFILGALVFSLSACNTSNENSGGSNDPTPGHEHTYSSSWNYDDTYHWHDATCGHDVVSNKERHTFNDVVTPATYSAGGYTTHTCTVCGYSYTDSQTDQLVHHYESGWSHDESTHWHACTDSGYEHLKSGEASHSFNDVVTPATYSAGGYTTHTCTVCGYSYTDSQTDQLVHHYESGWSHDESTHWHACTDSGYEHLKSGEASHSFNDVVTPATYSAGGYTTHTCTVCGYSYTDSQTDQLVHHYESGWSHDESTHWHACTDSGYEHLKSGEASHSFNDVVTPATYSAGGYTTHTCTVCGYSYTDSQTDQLVHHYESGWSHDESTHWHACTDSGYEHLKSGEASHSFNDVVTPATYSAGGYTTHTCTVCGYSYTDSQTDQLVHHYESGWSHDESTHWHACTDSGYEHLKSGEASHSFNDVVTPATYSAGGYTTHTCTVCGYSYTDSQTDQLVHHYESGWSHDESTHWHACTDSGYEHLKSGEASHSFNDVVTPATYSAGGYTTHTCTVCGYSYTDSQTDQLVHHYESGWSHDESTHWHACTDSGYEHLKSGEASHSFNDVVTPATYSAGGYTTHTCTVCGYSYTDSQTDQLPITILWKNWDGTILETDTNVPYKSTPEYNGETPTKSSTSHYSYSFTGWSPDVTLAVGSAVYIAQYNDSPINYSIEYELNGGTTTNPNSYSIALGDFTLSYPSRNGYDFVGWTGSNGNVPEMNVTINCESATNYHFVANWHIAIYSITYHLFGATNSIKNPSSYTIEDTLTLNAASKYGYTFVGWFLDSNFENEITNLYGHYGNLDLYAKLTPLSYSALFDSSDTYYLLKYQCDDISLNREVKFTSGDDVRPYDYIPIKDGFVFDGWEDENNNLISQDYVLEGDLILKPRWFSTGYKLGNLFSYSSASSNSTSTSSDSQTRYIYLPSYYNETVNSLYIEVRVSLGSGSSAFRRSGSAGYYVTDVTDNRSIISKSGSKDMSAHSTGSSSYYTYYYSETISVTLTPGHVYKIKTSASANGFGVSASARSTGGMLTFDNFALRLSESLTRDYDSQLNAPSPHKDGYDFAGWYDESNNPISDVWKYDSNQEFHSSWTVHNYNIWYVLDGGTNNNLNPSSYTLNDTVVLQSPNKDGYSFGGWYLDTSFSQKIEQIDGNEFKDFTLYAKWIANNYTATLDYNGGQNCPIVNFYSRGEIIKTVTLYDQTSLDFFIPESPFENWVFAGWYLEPSCENFYSFYNRYDSDPITHDLNLYANWVNLSDYNYQQYCLLGTNNNLSIQGTQYQYIAIVVPSHQYITITSESEYDLFGILYDKDMNEINRSDDISNEDLDFSISYSLRPGLYFIACKANQASVNGDCVISISGTYNPTTAAEGKAMFTDTSIEVTYGEAFELPVLYKEGYVFLGWYDENDNLVDTNSWNYAGNVTLHARWSPIN